MYLTLLMYQTICCVIQKNRLIETVLSSTTTYDPMLKETVKMSFSIFISKLIWSCLNKDAEPTGRVPIASYALGRQVIVLTG